MGLVVFLNDGTAGIDQDVGVEHPSLLNALYSPIRHQFKQEPRSGRGQARGYLLLPTRVPAWLRIADLVEKQHCPQNVSDAILLHSWR